MHLGCTGDAIEEKQATWEQWSVPETSWETTFSIVHNGTVLLNNDSIDATTAPAGIKELSRLQFQLSNISDENIQLDHTTWLTTGVLTWEDRPPNEIASGEQITFSLLFDPSTVMIGGNYTDSIIMQDRDYQFDINLVVPPPLRSILGGNNGYVLVTDTYGADFYEGAQASPDSPTVLMDLSWGNGIFFRAQAVGTDNDGVGLYDYSYDGLTWKQTDTAEEFASADCSYGLQRFVCVRSDTLSWSTTGQIVEHEETLFDYKLNAILFTGTKFIAVGRGARRAISSDGRTWEEENFGEDPDTYHSIIKGDDILVAGGGINRYYLSYSEDEGETWVDVPYGGCNGNRIQSLAFSDGLFLAHGQSSCHHNMHRSEDGKSWDPIIALHPFESYELLGVTNGWFIGQSEDEFQTAIFRSKDGEIWEHVHDLPQGQKITSMTTEEWR